MSVLRRLPFVRKAVRHTTLVENQLSVLEHRTAELGPGVVHTLVYDSASALEALEHIVSTLRTQDESTSDLHAQLVAVRDAVLAGQTDDRQDDRSLELLMHANERQVAAQLALAERLDQMGQATSVILGMLADLRDSVHAVGEGVSHTLRENIGEDISVGVELLTKEIGRIDVSLGEAVKSRAEISSNYWMRLEMTLRNEVSSEVQRSEARVLKDVAHARELLSADLTARIGQVGSDLVRSELARRDDSARRIADTRLPVSFADRGQGVAPAESHAPPHPVSHVPSQAELAPLEVVQFAAMVELGRTAPELPPSTARLGDISWSGRVRSNPIDPEIHLARAIAPHLAGELAIDVGAHRGRWASALSKEGLQVVALEPNPPLAEELRRRFGTSSRVAVVEAAAAAADGEATLYLAEDSTLGALHGDTSRFATTATRCSADGLQLTPGPSVRTVTIAHVAQDCGTSAVALVRIATEGTEYEVLEGIGLLRPEVVVSEFFGRGHPRAAREAPGTNAMIEAMIARGYRRWIGLIEVGESLQVRRNPQTFPEDCAGCLFFFAANDVFSIAARWCDENLVGGCQ